MADKDEAINKYNIELGIYYKLKTKKALSTLWAGLLWFVMVVSILVPPTAVRDNPSDLIKDLIVIVKASTVAIVAAILLNAGASHRRRIYDEAADRREKLVAWRKTAKAKGIDLENPDW